MIDDIRSIFTLSLVVGAIIFFYVMKWIGKAGRRAFAAAVAGFGFELGRGAAKAIFRRGEGRGAQPRTALPCDDMYAQCRLSRFTGDPSTCRWCGGALPERAKKFCRPQCRREGSINHDFSKAKEFVLERDGYRCRTSGCGAEATHERALEVHHAHTPARGRHAQQGCWHHVDGLVTLCWRCHLKETNRGRRVS